MANEFTGLLADALNNPLIGLGAGLLSAPRGATLGQSIVSGLNVASGLQGQQSRNALLREGLRERQAAREAAEQRNAAIQQIAGQLASPQPADTAATERPIDLLRGFALIGPEDIAVIDEGGAVPGVSGPAASQGQAGGLLANATPQERQFMGLLAQAAPEQFIGLLAENLRPPRPGSLERDFTFLTSLGVSQDDALATLRRGTTVNVGEANKPLSVSDLKNLRLPDGSVPPIGMTPAQALQSGAVILTKEQQGGLDAAAKFGPVLDRLEALALGEGGVFSNIDPGFNNRAQAAFDLFIGGVTRERPNIAEYEALAQGTIAPIIRQLGDSGALSNDDVTRALALLPQIRDGFLLPDTREDARRKLDTLRSILEQGEKNLRGQIGQGTTRTTDTQATSGATANDPLGLR